MLVRSVLFVVVATALACSGSSPSSPDAAMRPLPDAAVQIPDAGMLQVKTVRVATFNVHRFFDTVCASGACNPGDYEEAPSESAFRAKARQLAEAITEIDADVLMLEEIETQACVDALSEALDGGYPVTVLGEIGTPASVDVAVFARAELLEVRRHRQMQIPEPDGGVTTFSRELLEVHLLRDGARINAFAAHFRSKSSDDPERRLAEAIATRGIMVATSEEFPDGLTVLGGDLNDVPGSPPIDALEEGGALHRVAKQISDDAAATYTFFAERQAIDHLFVTADDRVVPASVFVHGGGLGFGGSDHSALSASFTLPCAQSSGGCAAP